LKSVIIIIGDFQIVFKQAETMLKFHARIKNCRNHYTK